MLLSSVEFTLLGTSCSPFFSKDNLGHDATLFNTPSLPPSTELPHTLVPLISWAHLSSHLFQPTFHFSKSVRWSFMCCTLSFFYNLSYAISSIWLCFPSSVPQDEYQIAYLPKLSSVISIFLCKLNIISVFSSFPLYSIWTIFMVHMSSYHLIIIWKIYSSPNLGCPRLTCHHHLPWLMPTTF